ncbi:hypothetical protein TNCT_363021 [Trichonephila clavata]|uniref:Uncharacterized protein n=1 Tax=Trichonephila clavata TaxID=2740835 RepID=A0A8X6J9P1_TRICU|nr:hypothetical protein TNCT_363021 [Trichonephila clavata]
MQAPGRTLSSRASEGRPRSKGAERTPSEAERRTRPAATSLESSEKCVARQRLSLRRRSETQYSDGSDSDPFPSEQFHVS